MKFKISYLSYAIFLFSMFMVVTDRAGNEWLMFWGGGYDNNCCAERVQRGDER